MMKRKRSSEDVRKGALNKKGVKGEKQAVLDAIMLQRKDRRSDVPPKTDISASMLTAYKSVSVNNNRPSKAMSHQDTVKSTSAVGNQSKNSTPTSITLSKNVTTRSTKNAILVPTARTPRVIGREADIRSQLLSKFTEVAASKHLLQKQRRSIHLPSNSPTTTKSNKTTPNISTACILDGVLQTPSSSHDSTSALGSSEITPKIEPSFDFQNNSSKSNKKVPPKVQCPKPRKTFSKQNIAFADPVRKVAGAVQSMFSNAFTKVLTSQTSKNSKPLELFRFSTDNSKESANPLGLASEKPKFFRLRNRKTGINFTSDIVKVEIVTDEQEDEEYVFDSQRNNMRLSTQGNHNMHIEDGDSTEHEDPLSDSSVPIIKVEAGNDTAAGEETTDSQFDSHLFGGQYTDACETEESDQTMVDVKPLLLPQTETDSSVIVPDMGNLANDHSIVDSLQIVVKTENVD